MLCIGGALVLAGSVGAPQRADGLACIYNILGQQQPCVEVTTEQQCTSDPYYGAIRCDSCANWVQDKDGIPRCASVSVGDAKVVSPKSTCNPESYNVGTILPQCAACGNCGAEDFVGLFINLYAFGVHLAVPIAVFFIIIGGIMMLTAAGYTNRIDQGKNMVTQAVVGLIVVLLSWVIVDTAIYVITGDARRTIFNKPWFGGFTYHCTDALLENRCQGSNVSSLENDLKTLGYLSGADGVYNTETTNAVLHFQKDFNRIFPAAGATCSQRMFDFVACGTDNKDPDAEPCFYPENTYDLIRLTENGKADTATQQRADEIARFDAQTFITSCATP